MTDYFEVNVQEGDHVSVWNQDDPEWYWIVKHDTNEEGFVSSGCLKEIGSDTHSISRSYSEFKFNSLELSVRNGPKTCMSGYI